MNMLWCQGAQDIGLSNRSEICAKVHRVITLHACPIDSQTDERTPWQKEHRSSRISRENESGVSNVERSMIESIYTEKIRFELTATVKE